MAFQCCAVLCKKCTAHSMPMPLLLLLCRIPHFSVMLYVIHLPWTSKRPYTCIHYSFGCLLSSHCFLTFLCDVMYILRLSCLQPLFFILRIFVGSFDMFFVSHTHSLTLSNWESQFIFQLCFVTCTEGYVIFKCRALINLLGAEIEKSVNASLRFSVVPLWKKKITIEHRSNLALIVWLHTQWLLL